MTNERCFMCSSKNSEIRNPETLQKMEESYASIIKSVGENIERDGLLKTPHRAAKAFQFLTEGYEQDIDSVVNGAMFETENEEMVIVKDIEFYSLCEHHLLPFFGKCHVAYVPNGKIIGLSKIARIVNMFARRLQVQENLTKQISETIQEQTGGQGVGVVMEAKHFCMVMRGVQKQSSSMKTSSMLGLFRKDPKTRAEFLSLIS